MQINGRAETLLAVREKTVARFLIMASFGWGDPYGRGERKAHQLPPSSAAVIGFWGDCAFPGRSPLAAEGSHNPSLTASGGSYSASALPNMGGTPKEAR
jgi:hypothetical protein